VGWIDAHAHPERVELADELARMRDAGVDGFVAVGTDRDSSSQAIEVAAEARAQGCLAWATVGVHPHDAESHGAGDLEQLARLARGQPDLVVGVGECGLDFYYGKSPREVQLAMFEAQVELARQLGVTLVIHARDAWEETFAMLARVARPPQVVLHCFTGGPSEVRRALALDCWISFSGIVTFKKAGEVREAFLATPLERVLVETDTPFLSPEPLRGQPNHVANVAVTGAYLASLRGLDPADLQSMTRQNTLDAFQIT
jgi:TatD DNase family protein